MFRFSLLLASVICSAACASIVHGPYQKIKIDSAPSRANVTVFEAHSKQPLVKTTTPGTVQLRRGAGYFRSASYHILVEAQGYPAQEIILEGKVNNWYIAGNFFGGGWLGYLVVDPLTGAMWTLTPTSPMYRNYQDGLFIDLRQNVDPKMVPYLKQIGEVPCETDPYNVDPY